MQPRMSRENIVAFVMRQFIRVAAVLWEITIPDDNVLSMTPRNLDETPKLAANYFFPHVVERTKIKRN